MNILLPTDFSANSNNAATYALQYFKGLPCNFHLLHVGLYTEERTKTKVNSLPATVKARFDQLISELQSIKKDTSHNFQAFYKNDFLIEAVRQYVSENNIDLILMGTKGVSNKEDVILGKNTSDVLMKVKCPALAISENAVFKARPEILFPTDYKIQYNSKMLEPLFTLSNHAKASIKILELFNSELEPSAEQIVNRNFLYNSFGHGVPGVQTIYSFRNSNFFESNENVDMIVMAAKSLNLCQRLLKNNTQNQIPFIRKRPMLVLHG